MARDHQLRVVRGLGAFAPVDDGLEVEDEYRWVARGQRDGIGRARRDNARMTARPRAQPASQPLTEHDIDRLQALLDTLPAPFEPLDVAMLDGYLCGVLLQPQPVPAERWLPHVTDTDGRALPAGLDVQPLLALVLRRHAELGAAIARRQWFDPWVFELEAEAPSRRPTTATRIGTTPPWRRSEAVYPWVAGFAAAMEIFPGLMSLQAPALLEPLALLYRHLDAEDLEDADDLLAVIDSLEPPADLEQAVEELVRATLLLADVSRPLPKPEHAPHRRPAHRQPRGSRSGRR